MIIPNPSVKLVYDPAKYVLTVEWPDFQDYFTSKAIYILDTILETIRHYDVKFLLTDTRDRLVSIPDAQYKEIAMKFAKDLTQTRLQKLARVVTAQTLRENAVNEIKQEANLRVPIGSFSLAHL